MRLPDLALYGWVTLLAFVGHLTSFLFPLVPTNTPRFPWRRLVLSLPLCFVLGLVGAALAEWFHWGDTVRDGLAAVFGYGGTAIINAVLQTLLERIKGKASP